MKETFNKQQVINAIESFLEFGEQDFNPEKGARFAPDLFGHAGYFSGGGWAARCLRWHLEKLKKRSRS